MRRSFALVVMVLSGLFTAWPNGPATAGGPVQWVQISDNAVASLDQIGLLRVGKKVFVAWARGGPTDSLMFTIIGQDGKVGKASPIVSDWAGIGAASLVPTKNGGARVFFNGIDSGDPTSPHEGLNTATAPAAGTPWKLAPAAVTAGDLAHVRPPSAAVSKDLTPFEAWHTSGPTIALHRGLDRTEKNKRFDSATPYCCSVNPNLATDQVTGKMFLAWCVDSEKRNGMTVQGVDIASGGPVGKKEVLDTSATSFEGRLRRDCDGSRTAIAARRCGGVFVAAQVGFPTPNRVMLWRLGTKKPLVIDTSPIAHNFVAVAAERSGRIWVAWAEAQGGGGAVVLRRSDPQGKTFGPRIVLPAPPDWTAGIYDVALSAGPAGADLFVRFLSFSGRLGLLYTRVSP